MAGIFKVNKANLALLRATIRQYGEAWIHGCGNIYNTEEDSNFRKEFTNPNPDKTPPASAYVLHFTDAKEVPNDLDRMEELFIKSKANEVREAERQKSTAKVHTVSVTEADIHADDEDDEDFVNSVVAKKPTTGPRKVIQTVAQAEESKGFKIQDKEPVISVKESKVQASGAGISI